MSKKSCVIIAFVAVFLLLGVLLVANGCRSGSTVGSGVEKQTSLTSDSVRNEVEKEKAGEIPQYPQPCIRIDDRTLLCSTKMPKEIPHQLLTYRAYYLSYNNMTLLPNWAGWHLTAAHTDGPVGRLNSFHEEDQLSSPRVTLADFKGSGWSRGHMCPAGDNKWDRQAMYDTFTLANVCPQNANLNQGLWNSIEMDCRQWARRFGDIYIVCGPLFLRREHERIGENDIPVPEAFFKVILCLNGKPKAFGFIVRNTDGNRKRDLYYNSVDEVERITGYDFFSALPDDIENEVEAHADINEWK